MGSTMAVTRSELNKVQTFSDVNELIATTLVDQYVKQVDSNASHLGEVKGKIHPEDDDRGFSLQPISTVLHDTSDQDSPPTESLKSIKSIAEDRKRKLLEKSRKSQRDIRTAPAGHIISDKTKTPKKSK